MKKVCIVLLIAITLVSFSGCGKENAVDDSINVMFFTANSNASLVPSYLNLSEGQKIEKPEDPTREGFLFTGWYRDFYKTEPWDFEIDVVGKESLVLYADWKPSIFTITYELNGGTMPNDNYITTFTSGQFGVLPLPSREGFAFVSWFIYDWLDENGEITTIPGDSGYQKIPDVYDDVYLYAHWDPIVVEVKFKVNYPVDNPPELDVSRLNVNYGDAIDFAVLEDTEGYEFIGWNVKRDGTGAFYENGDTFIRTLRLTLYAIWIAK